MANKTITATKGFLAAGVSSGVKKSGKLDLGLLICPAGAKFSAWVGADIGVMSFVFEF